MNCIIIDDEPLALELLEDNISRIPFLDLKAKFSNPIDSLSFLREEAIDLIFLDIQMPGLSGLQLLKTLSNPPMVIFITAYKNYALEGYEFNVVDFLVKPVEFDRFVKACEKAQQQFLLMNPTIGSLAKSSIFVHSEYSLVKVQLQDICYVEGLKDYVKIHLSTTSKPILTRQNLKAMEEKLGDRDFSRIHKSFIVSLDKVESFRKNIVQVNGVEIPLSDSYKEAFLEGIRSKGQII